MQRSVDCDVLIAGAGPAGAAAAAHLGAAGLHVILVDWQSFPRDKVCGDFVSPVALREIKAFGFTGRLGNKRSNVVRRASVYLDGNHLLSSAIPQVKGLEASGRVIPRKALDNWILGKALASGAKILEGHRVNTFHARPDHIGVEVASSGGVKVFRTRILIAADGSTSSIARRVRHGAVADDDRIIAVRGYFEGIAGPPDRADLYFSSDVFPGYCWVFPTGKKQANVGLGMVRKTIPPAGDHLRDLLLRLIAEDRALKDRLAGARLVGGIVGWPLTTYNSRLPLVADRVILIGDAAGLINPLNGEGIQYALLSARWAAEVVTSCCSQGDFSLPALNAYAARVKAELDDDMTIGRALVALICNRSLNTLWLEALQIIASRAATDPEYAQIAGGILAGVMPARDLIRLPVLRGTVEQAVRWSGLWALRELSARPKNLLELGAKMTQVAINVLSPMMAHQTESELWALNVVQSAMDVARVATQKNSQRSGRPGASSRKVSATTHQPRAQTVK